MLYSEPCFSPSQSNRHVGLPWRGAHSVGKVLHGVLQDTTVIHSNI